MPNHISNLVRVQGKESDVQKFLTKVIGKDKDWNGEEVDTFDFNRIIPMPVELDLKTESSEVIYFIEGTKPFPDWAESDPEKKVQFLKEVELYKPNMAKYGAYTWYGWRREHWGTKWNSYDFFWVDEGSTDEDGNFTVSFMFNTAWSTPYGIWEAVAVQYPDLEIDVVYADEDTGYNAGRFHLIDGCDYEYETKGGSDEAMECYFETHPGSEEFWVKNEDGEWVWAEDEDEDEEEDDESPTE